MKHFIRKHTHAGIALGIVGAVFGATYFFAQFAFAMLPVGGGGGVVPNDAFISIYSSPVSIVSGSSSTINWTTSFAKNCVASGSWSGTKATSGSQSTGVLTTPGTYTYTLYCVATQIGGLSDTQSATVSVTAPAPTVSLSASPTSITSPSASTLTWSSANATSCTASGSWSGAKALSGSASTGALAVGTYTYNLSCSGPGGTGTRSATVTVAPPPVPTATLSVSPNPTPYNTRPTITWSSTNATSCTAGGPWSNSGTLSGSGLTNPLTANTTFTFQCTGPGGTSPLQSVTEVVGPAPAPTVTLSAAPMSVGPGGSSTLTWSSANATSCTASGSWSGAKALSGTASTGALSSVGSYAYTLTCSGVGGSTSKSVTVAVVGGGNLSGFAWAGGGVGWISFNSASDGSTAPYSVKVDTTNRASGGTGLFSGYAWSGNIGWVSFNSSDLTSCPSGTCSAQINWANGVVTGWARALSATTSGGGWDGWIQLSGDTVSVWAGRGVKMDLVSGQFSGYAWGGPVLGWIDFGSTIGTTFVGVLGPQSCGNGANNPPTCNTCTAPLTWNGASCILPAAPTLTFTGSPLSVTAGSASTLAWSSTNTTSCTASGSWSGAKALSGSASTGALAAGSYTYNLSCAGLGGTVSNSVIIVASNPVPTISISASPASVGIGGSSTLSWSTTNATSCTASGSWSGAQALSGSTTVGPITSGAHTYTLSCSGPGGTATNSAVVSASAVCGNGKCETGETILTCPIDCKTNVVQF